MEIYTSFQTALQMALWINSKNFTAHQQEYLMNSGIKNKAVKGEYCLLFTNFTNHGIELPI
jgi:hypothetical protein